MLCDLHTHTTASDGQYTPTELVGLAKARGLSVLAVTDHDTIAGVTEAQRAGSELDLTVIRGVELSAKDYPNCHILGYRFQDGDTELARLCERFRAGRDERKYKIVDFLREKGVDIDLAEVEEIAGGEVIARPHFAQALVRRGYVSSNREAFDRYLDTQEFLRRVERPKPPARVCLETIRAAGGKTSLAHPYQIGVDNEKLEDIVRELAGLGLDAIECCYPRHTPEQQEFYLHLAEKYGLHVTGGSDFHGERVKPDIRLAAWELETDWLK